MQSKNVLVSRNGGRTPATWHPLQNFHEEMERLFDRYMPERLTTSLFGENELTAFAQMDVSESDKAIEVSLDVPGMSEKDIEVMLSDNELKISGERKVESEEKKKDFHRIERSYGRFERRYLLPCEVDEGKVTASVSKGVLTITLPKSAKAKANAKKIAIKGA